MKKAVLNLAIERAELILSGKVMYGGHEKQLAMALIQLWQKQPSPTEAEEKDKRMFPGFYLLPEQEHDALQRDAARYRWLRFMLCEDASGEWPEYGGTMDDLDVHIDREIAKRPTATEQP